jgi:hypothetical protein
MADMQSREEQTYSDYYNRIIVNQVSPELDIAWQTRLQSIFSKMPKAWCQRVSEEALSIKKIYWDEASNTFTHRPDSMDLAMFVSDQCHEKLKPLGKWCIEGVERLKRMDCALEISDLLENIIGKINSFDLEEYRGAESSRRVLREKFICEAAMVIKKKPQLKVPDNRRNLTSDVIKSFINEVFLKQSLLGYGFAVLRKGQLSRMEQPLLKTWLCRQQSVRQLEVVHTTQYVFAVANTFQEAINIFSARRFLSEDRIKDVLYVNGAFIGNDHLTSREHCQAFAAQIACIVSVGGQTTQAVVELLDSLEELYFEKIIPQLFSPLKTHDTTLETAVRRKLGIYRQDIETRIIAPFKVGLLNMAGHQEDFNYLFMGIQQIMGQIMMDFREIMTRPALLKNVMAERLMVQLSAYAELLNKRRELIFNRTAVSEWDGHRKEIARMHSEVRGALRDVKKKFAAEKKQIQNLEQMIKSKSSLMDKILGRKNKWRRQLADIQEDLMKTRRMGYTSVLNALGKNKAHWLYVDHGDMLFLEGAQCYALCSDENGVNMLPSLFVLPENYRDFNPGKCLNALEGKVTDSSGDSVMFSN